MTHFCVSAGQLFRSLFIPQIRRGVFRKTSNRGFKSLKLSLWFKFGGRKRAMDPLGVTISVVEASLLPRWSSTPVPDYGSNLQSMQPSNGRRTESPFPVRQDLNAKVALW